MAARHEAREDVTLDHRTVYILPTGAGWMLAATLLVLLVASINYQLNLGYLLTFLLAGSALAAMHVGHANLRGLRLRLGPSPRCFAGAAAPLVVALAEADGRARWALAVRTVQAPEGWAYADVPAQGQASVELAWTPAQRGRQTPPLVIVQSLFPLGSFRVWTVWQPLRPVLVYPAPEPAAPPLPQPAPEPFSDLARSTRAMALPEEFHGLRPWRPSDGLRRVAWKKFARSGELLTRDASGAAPAPLWLDLVQTGLRDREAALSRLCAWVLAADRLGLRYGLRLGELRLAPDRGAAHCDACLSALALYPREPGA